ncbi:MAG: hypothetical protein WD295_03480 [Bacteroidota bacterium]
MNRLSLVLYALLILFIGYLTSVLVTDFVAPGPRRSLPFVFWVIQTINLFIHEGGHGIFQIFGRFMEILGGSLMEVLIPAVTVVVFLKSGVHTLVATLYWLGHAIVSVGIYMSDAAYRKLPLISKHAIHDWGWICDTLGITHLAEDIGAVVIGLGIIVAFAGLGVGLWSLVKNIREEFFPPPSIPKPPIRRPSPGS